MVTRKARLVPEIDKMAPKMVNAGVILDRAAEREVSAGQRRVNLLWESSQSAIAISITVAIIAAVFTDNVSAELSNAFFLVVGFYFGRTNHTRTGGVSVGEEGR